MTEEQFKPCPFCGSHDIAMAFACGDEWVECNNCGAMSQMFSNGKKAREYWNRRANE